jgi:hypothetical protein
MTTTPDFRAHCEKLVELLEDEWSGVSVQPEALTRARAALATPPPKPPTDKDLWETGDDFFQANYYPTDAIKFARAVLERWGNH